MFFARVQRWLSFCRLVVKIAAMQLLAFGFAPAQNPPTVTTLTITRDCNVRTWVAHVHGEAYGRRKCWSGQTKLRTDGMCA
jgi:hypothetical protein